MKESLFESC